MADWQLDPFHTQVEFSAKHLEMTATVRETSRTSARPAKFDPDHPESFAVEVTIQALSIHT